MFLVSGTRLLLCHRRLFDEDQPRFFAGVVSNAEGGLAKVSGYSWTGDPARGFECKQDPRTKIVAVGSGSILVYELPADLCIDDLRIEQPGGQSVTLTDGRDFEMNLSEHLAHPTA